MMERLWSEILERFGQEVVLRRAEGDLRLRALIQPCLDGERGQERPGPLGLERRDRFLYLGPPGCPVDLDTEVEWKGGIYRVRSAYLVGEGACAYWRAVLVPREGAEL